MGPWAGGGATAASSSSFSPQRSSFLPFAAAVPSSELRPGWRCKSSCSAGLPARLGVPEAGPRPLVSQSSVGEGRRQPASPNEAQAARPAFTLYLEISTRSILSAGEGKRRAGLGDPALSRRTSPVGRGGGEAEWSGPGSFTLRARSALKRDRRS